MKVREMELADLDAVVEISKELMQKPAQPGLGYLVAPPSTEDFISAISSKTEIVLVLENESDIIGYYFGTTRLCGMSSKLTEIMADEHPFLYGKNVGIAVKHQKNGYAKKFYDYLFEKYKDLNYYEVNIEGNETAFRFKKKLGMDVYKEYYTSSGKLRYLFIKRSEDKNVVNV